MYTVQVILSASESASLRALFRPSSFTQKVRPEGSPRGGGGAVCRRKILSSVHRPPFGTKTVEKALYTYTRGLVVVFVGLKKKCVHLFIKGVEIRSLKSPYEKIHSIKRTHDYDARTTVILTKLLSKKERESKKKSIIPSSSVFCDDQKNLSSSSVVEMMPQQTRTHAKR